MQTKVTDAMREAAISVVKERFPSANKLELAFFGCAIQDGLEAAFAESNRTGKESLQVAVTDDDVREALATFYDYAGPRNVQMDGTQTASYMRRVLEGFAQRKALK